MIDLIKDPIFNVSVNLRWEEAFSKVKELAKDFSVKSENKSSGTIVLDATYITSSVTFKTWVKKIVIQVQKSSEESSKISIYGVPVLLPYDLFFRSYFNKKKIDIDTLSSSFSKEFNNSVTNNRKPIKKSKLEHIAFYILEILSVLSLVKLFIYARSGRGEEDIITLLLHILMFIIPQIVLIVWFSRDCYSHTFSSHREKMRWISIIGTTGFVGSLFYYYKVFRKMKYE